MEDRIRFIEHKGKQILLADCSYCTAEELETMSRLVPSYVTAEPKESVLLLADFTGAQFDRVAIERLKLDLVFDRPHLKRSAWVGTETLPNIFYEHLKSFSQRELPTFKTREEAMDWLVAEQR
ncbi:MAG: STAS/SEC14 domain-containing protein [Candidatus Sulfotelmatobacter sp.]